MIRCREPRTTGRGCESAQGSVSGERFGHPGEGSSEAGVEQSFCREPNDLARAHLVESADTGAREHEATFLADVFGLVEPDDVRWIVISHDDVDHTGNLNALAAAAPNATIVIDWFMAERMGASLEVSPLRWRWMVDGERLDVGDRELVLVRPPIFDSPTSRGVFDPTTGVHWAADAFATPMPTPVSDVAEIDRTVWTEGMATFNQYISPWLMLAAEARSSRPSIASPRSTPLPSLVATHPSSGSATWPMPSRSRGALAVSAFPRSRTRPSSIRSS